MKEEITKQTEISPKAVSEIQSLLNVLEFKKKIEKYLGANITELLEIILGGAIHLRSSDIHFEPQKEKTRLRIRIDGMLYDVLVLETSLYHKILNRIKLLSGIKLNVTDRPQDGRFSILIKNDVIEVRASTLPSEYGETIVLRLLNPKDLISIEELGLRKDLLDLFLKEIKKPNGMIIVTGPTGSGKTTTLYAFLKEIQRPEIKVITIEDPIEYHLKGIAQTQVDPQKGYDFASGLRSIVRQDPDVILVGEIRDLETAQIALQAALTGHLVFTTLHTNDAAGTVTRLISLGAKPFNIAPALNLAIAQRLVRKVCTKCLKFKNADENELSKFKKHLKNLPKNIKIPNIQKGLKIPVAEGCPECNFTGYKGRTGIFEAFLVDSELESFILKSPSVSALKEKAIKKGMVTMYQDGLIKVLEGKTTLQEVERVTSP
ncbi:type II/IV secretion system protein [bacterium]|nr:type II/IV secretion system protein [bacterium]